MEEVKKLKNLRIDPEMKRLWPDTRVGCLQYKVTVEKKNEEMWKYLKKDIFKKAKDAIFDYGVNEIPNIKESRAAYKAFVYFEVPIAASRGLEAENCLSSISKVLNL